MTAEQARRLKVGDTVSAAPWNRTERPHRQFEDPCKITALRRLRGCQTGVMVEFKDALGRVGCLDAGWLD